MLLKSLELHGFKSFPDKTKLTFGRGITAVVGPNGSGKSNISDAVRWVLGEQSTKTLRSSKMEDVIFGGTQTRKAQGFAEVSLTIDNASSELGIDSDEVTITRKYYRSGESEYLINGSQVRLKDVNELFMDTGLGRDGYSLVGQGRIAEIVGAKSAERREIFEEAAGITKFRYRKEESERRLAAAEDNLLRLLDILEELETRIPSLKQQSEKAKQFLVYSEDKKRLEISHWVYTLRNCNRLLREQQDKIIIAQGQEENFRNRVEEIEQNIQEAYRLMQGYMTMSEQLRTEKQQLDEKNASAQAQKAVLENDISHHLSEIRRLEEELSAMTRSQEEMERDMEQRERSIEEKAERIGKIDLDLAETETILLEHQKKTSEDADRVSQLNTELNRIAIQISETRFQQNSLLASVSEWEDSAASEKRSLEEKEHLFLQTQEEHTHVVSSLDEIMQRISSLQNSVSGYEMKLNSRDNKLKAAQAENSALELSMKEKQQRIRLLTDLEQSMEGFSGSVKRVLSLAKSGALRGIVGSVAQLITVKSEYSVAIETALGPSLQHIVTSDEQAAKSAIYLLKEQRAGRATFLPMTTIRGSRLSEKGLEQLRGFVSVASDLVEYAPNYQGIILSLLGRIVIAEDLDSAAAIAKQFGFRFRIVTLDGQVVNTGGSMTGGSSNRNQGILSRKNDIEQLRQQVAQLQEKDSAQKETIQTYLQEVQRLNAQVVGIQSEIQTLTEDRIRFEGEEKRLAHYLEELKAQQQQQEEQIRFLFGRISSAEKEEKNAQETLKRLEEEQLRYSDELSVLEGRNNEAEEARNQLSERMGVLRVERAELQKEAESIREFIDALSKRRSDEDALFTETQEKIQLLQNENEEIRQQIALISGDSQKRSEDADEIVHKIAEVLKQREEQEGTANRLREEEKQITQQNEGIIRELARLEEQKVSIQKQYDDIIGKLWEEYELTRSQAEEIAEPVTDVILLQRDLNQVKNQIKSLGNVNLSAIEEYREVTERYEYLSGQIRDVEQSRDELRRLISDLTENMKELFTESFDKISRNFSQIFVELFGGGKGELSLSDPENVLESGIEINVQPPGKLIKNLASLSGGEQSFVAIAIYFAILKVHPAPFCILDEIEAALDDVNVAKYASYLRQLCDKSQFILITHRRGSMEEADVLYGVTMQQEGVSKLLSLNVSEIESKVGKLSS